MAAPAMTLHPVSTKVLDNALSTDDLTQDFQFVSRLGDGRYGQVSTYQERSTGRLFACKRVDLLPYERAETAAVEIDALQRAQGHPNVVALQGLYRDEEAAYILMEQCDGGSLLSRVRSTGGLGEDEARTIFRQLASALSHCHERGVIHRDVKPENVFLMSSERSSKGSNGESSSSGVKCSANSGSSNGGSGAAGSVEVRLGDFGLAVVLAKGQKASGLAGSQPYVAPEVLLGDTYGLSADVWSLGVVLYSMLSSSWPVFRRGLRRSFNAEANFVKPVWKTISPAAKDLIRRMLSFEPHLRPSMDEVLRDPWVAARQPLLPPLIADAINGLWPTVSGMAGNLKSTGQAAGEATALPPLPTFSWGGGGGGGGAAGPFWRLRGGGAAARAAAPPHCVRCGDSRCAVDSATRCTRSSDASSTSSTHAGSGEDGLMQGCDAENATCRQGGINAEPEMQVEGQRQAQEPCQYHNQCFQGQNGEQLHQLHVDSLQEEQLGFGQDLFRRVSSSFQFVLDSSWWTMLPSTPAPGVSKDATRADPYNMLRLRQAALSLAGL